MIKIIYQKDGKNYRKLERDEIIKEGAMHSYAGGDFYPIKNSDGKTVGSTPADFSNKRDFYNPITEEKENSNLLANVQLFYPEQRHNIWTYCIYLGPYTSPEGKNYDLGIYMDRKIVSGAIVYGNKPYEYISGPIEMIISWDIYPYYEETYKRAMRLKLHPNMYGGCVNGISSLKEEYFENENIDEERKIFIEALFNKYDIPLKEGN